MKRIPKTTVAYLKEKFAKHPISYKTAFVIVVLLHITAYGGLVLLNKYKSAPKKVIVAENTQGPYSDALEEVWPTDNSKLQVKARPVPKASPSIKPVAEVTKQANKEAAKVVAKPTPKSTPKPVVASTPPPSIKPIDEPERAVASTPSLTPAVASTPAPLPTPRSTPVVASTKLDENSPSLSAQIPPRPIFEQKPVPNHLPPDMDKALKEMAREIQRDVDSSSANKNTYTIQPGENLYMIARKLQVSFRSIVIANDIRDPRDLRVGQTLRIPRRQGI